MYVKVLNVLNITKITDDEASIKVCNMILDINFKNLTMNHFVNANCGKGNQSQHKAFICTKIDMPKK